MKIEIREDGNFYDEKGQQVSAEKLVKYVNLLDGYVARLSDSYRRLVEELKRRRA